jgi:hypothetical protein
MNKHSRDQVVLPIEQEILRAVAMEQGKVLALARKLVAQRLAPIDRTEARRFLRDIRTASAVDLASLKGLS